MSDAPDQIWIDSNGGNWSPCSGGTQDVEYRRADQPSRCLGAAMSAPVADKALAERLAYWRGLELECEALGAGRGFRLEEALGQAHRSGQLITLAEAQAMVAAELPEVQALVDAATALLVQVDGLIPIKHPQQKLERNKLRHAITALAAIKETKT